MPGLAHVTRSQAQLTLLYRNTDAGAAQEAVDPLALSVEKGDVQGEGVPYLINKVGRKTPVRVAQGVRVQRVVEPLCIV
jgi:hypothetical protein